MSNIEMYCNTARRTNGNPSNSHPHEPNTATHDLKRSMLLVRLHQLVTLDLLRKPGNVRTVTPRLELHLLPYRRRKAAQPPLPRKLTNRTLPGIFVQQAGDAIHGRMLTNIVKYGGELNDLPEQCDGALGSKILVADDGLADGVGLILGRPGV